MRDETSEEQRTLASRDCRRGTGAQTRRRGDTRDRAQLRRRGKARGAPRARGNGRCGAGKLTPQSRQVRGMPASLGAYWRGEHSCTGWPCTAPKLPCGQKASIDHRPLRTSQGTRYTLKRQPPSDAPCPCRCSRGGLAMHACTARAAYRSAVALALAAERCPRRDLGGSAHPSTFGRCP